MLRDPPPHLNLDITPEASAAFTLSAHGVDSHCKAMKPSRDISCTDSSTQPVVGPDLDLSQENSKKSEKIPKKSEKNSGNPQDTSYGDILDPTLHALALALPLCPVREETLLKAIYLEDWKDFTLDGLLPAQRMAYNLLFEILTPYPWASWTAWSPLPAFQHVCSLALKMECNPRGQKGEPSWEVPLSDWTGVPRESGSSRGRVVYGAGLGGGCRVVA